MLNNVTLMGRLTSEPELKNTDSGKAVLPFSIATERKYSKDGKKETDFFDIVAWRHTAEFISKYFHKGSMIAIEGYLQTRVWEDKEGKKRKSIEIIADRVHFAGSKNSENTSANNESAATDDNFTPEDDESDLPF